MDIRRHGGYAMDMGRTTTSTIPVDELPDWVDWTPDIDELRVPLDAWTDPAAPAGDGAAERHIVRSID
jgi:hypothetical protein